MPPRDPEFQKKHKTYCKSKFLEGEIAMAGDMWGANLLDSKLLVANRPTNSKKRWTLVQFLMSQDLHPLALGLTSTLRS